MQPEKKKNNYQSATFQKGGKIFFSIKKIKFFPPKRTKIISWGMAQIVYYVFKIHCSLQNHVHV